jgi:hypothetical protein
VSTAGDQGKPKAPGSVVESVRAELETAGRLDNSLGQQALSLASRLDGGSSFDTGSALAAVSRELRSVMELALRDATTVADPLDEFTARRERKAAGA